MRRLTGVERWISILRLLAFPVVLVPVIDTSYPGGWEMRVTVTTVAYALGAICLFALARSRVGTARPLLQSVVAQLFDTAIVTGYVFSFSFEPGAPVQQALYIDLAAACVRFEIIGGLLVAIVSAPIVALFERLRVERTGIAYSWKLVAVQTSFEGLLALIVGWLVRRLAIEGAAAEARAQEAEQLRDELAKRAERADAAYASERRRVEELRRLSSLRADFVSMVSHEVRTPMAAVIGAAQALRERWRELSVEQRDAFLTLIADEIGRLAALVGEVLDSSRIDERTFSYSFEELDLGALIGDTIAAAELGHEGVHISASVPAALPIVRGDPVRLRQVLTNLIDNAIKYSPEGSAIEVRASTRNGDASVEVVDHGAGIASDDQQLIFEKFGRLRGTSSKPGSGLGLYIARAIADAHGGALDVRSSPGAGSTFTLRLPLG